MYEACKERKTFVIGTDSNQNYLANIKETGENFGLTSMLTQVDVAVYLTIQDVIDGKFQAGVRTFGLADTVTIKDVTYHGVYYAMDDYNKALVTPEMIENVTEAEKKRFLHELDFAEGTYPIMIAGSTHKGENGSVYKAFVKIRDHFPEAKLIIAPRYI